MIKPMEIRTSKPIQTSGVKPPAPGREMGEFLERSAKGDERTIPQIHALLADPERGPIALHHCGTSAQWLRQAVAKKASGGNLLVMEAVQRKIDQTRTELEGPNPTPIERLLAERAALCWQIANWYENNFVNAEGLTITQADCLQRRIDRAHRRFLSAVETLARVRKLAVPMLQVNVARNQQINAGAK
ncbi:MAG: hypothetical protein U0790_02540 [Isosphaeraceae bacterium]